MILALHCSELYDFKSRGFCNLSVRELCDSELARVCACVCLNVPLLSSLKMKSLCLSDLAPCYTAFYRVSRI